MRYRYYLLALPVILLSALVACQPTPRSTVPTLVTATFTRVASTTSSPLAAVSLTHTPTPVFSPTSAPSNPPPTLTPPSPTVTPSCSISSSDSDISPTNTGRWCFSPNTLIHPLAIEVDLNRDKIYLLDSGRVLSLSASSPSPPQLLLAPGHDVVGTRVIEPLDLALTPASLLVLDRAGDVYRYDLANGRWALDRYDRLIRDTSSHYFVALAAAAENRYLVETSYSYGLRYLPEAAEALWSLPDAYLIDLDVTLAAEDDSSLAYLLYQPFDSSDGRLRLYRHGRVDTDFAPNLTITQPRQVRVADRAIFLLDQAGKRLNKLNSETGEALSAWRLPESISTFWVNPEANAIWLAGRDALYFVEQPEKTAFIVSDITLSQAYPHDSRWLSALPKLLFPTSGSAVAPRDLRLPGAPRHYRLGVHQGLDFYWSPGKPVRAVADGTIVRLTSDYVTPTPQQFADWRSEARTLGYTPAEALDFYRGRQIWVEHAHGLISRYAHLSEIEADLEIGTAVIQGQPLGKIGNSGSPASQESRTADAHLHFELWLGDHYLGQFMRPIETREWLNAIFSRNEEQ